MMLHDIGDAHVRMHKAKLLERLVQGSQHLSVSHSRSRLKLVYTASGQHR